MNDTDIELERRLRAHFRDERATDPTPLALACRRPGDPADRGSDEVADGPASRPDPPRGDGRAWHRRCRVGRACREPQPERPRPSPPAFAVAPSPSAEPRLDGRPVGQPVGRRVGQPVGQPCAIDHPPTAPDRPSSTSPRRDRGRVEGRRDDVPGADPAHRNAAAGRPGARGRRDHLRQDADHVRRDLGSRRRRRSPRQGPSRSRGSDTRRRCSTTGASSSWVARTGSKRAPSTRLRSGIQPRDASSLWGRCLPCPLA